VVEARYVRVGEEKNKKQQQCNCACICEVDPFVTADEVCCGCCCTDTRNT